MRFFLIDLGEQKVILGYPWFAAMQPKVDWARAWIDYEQLLVVVTGVDPITIRRSLNTELVTAAL
jgi:hypothetical protein